MIDNTNQRPFQLLHVDTGGASYRRWQADRCWDRESIVKAL